MVKGIILAAGRGSRLGGRTDDRPKCMVELWGKPLLHWQISALHGAGINDITIVRGYMADKINVPGVSFLENKRWAETNMVATLMEARQTLASSPVVVSYSDIVYSSGAISRLLDGSGDIRITYDPDWRKLWEARFTDPLSDAETFLRDEKTGKLLEIGGRPSSYDEVQGQYMGLLYFEPFGWECVDRFMNKLEPAARDRIDCTTMLRQLMLNHEVQTVPIHDKWYEVDNNHDLDIYSKLEPVLRQIS